MTLIILVVMNRIPGLSLRISDESETQGIDCDQFNEYTHDFIQVQRDLYASMPNAPSRTSLMTVTTIDSQTAPQKPNEVRMIKVKPAQAQENEW